MRKILATALAPLLLVGCSTGTYEKMMEQGETALQNGKYEKALASFELARDEKPKDEKAKTYTDNLTEFIDIQKLQDEGEFAKAQEKADLLLKEDLPADLKKDLQDLEKQSKDAKVAVEGVESRLDSIKRLVDKEETDKAEKGLDKLKQSAEWKDYGSHFDKQLASIEESLEAAKDGKQRAAKEEQDRVAETTKQQQQVAAAQKSESSAKTSTYYYQRLAALDDETSNMEYHDNNGGSLEVPKEVYRRWDAALNEIYGELEKQLPAGEMETLRQRQRNWINERDAQAEQAAANVEDEYFAPSQRLYTLKEATKERCYELVNLYMR
ncbi:hypothetical protein QR721_02815 [Aciduricibacillus chroicocephali]|uniref:Lysozyme inhibitor LprI-like N-terminal domain-containing protein n=1 Tax=Aciduricibacillus chroicocephali TaxID=3054939 RepID=A0ABY9KWM0_9BACI|nr:hypothetical protein QR721_02815 [Bacillaceae bacterium 44XB]